MIRLDLGKEFVSRDIDLLTHQEKVTLDFLCQISQQIAHLIGGFGRILGHTLVYGHARCGRPRKVGNMTQSL